MTKPIANTATHPVGPSQRALRLGLRRSPEAEVVAIGIGMIAAAVGLYRLVPDAAASIRATGWWAIVVATVLFGLFEYTVFNIEFRQEAMSFSLSEVPTAIALVFLTPFEAVAARMPGSLLVLLVFRRNTSYKLLFNLSVFALELVTAILVFRGLADWWGGSDGAVIAATTVALLSVVPLTSIAISVAIGRFEGGTWARIVDELRSSWWMYAVNCVLAAMTVALALVEPWLAALATLPAAGLWFVLYSHGQIAQQLRDLDAVHGFAGVVSESLDPAEIADTAVHEIERLLRADGVALVRLRDSGPIVHATRTLPIEWPTGWPLAADQPRWGELISHAQPFLVPIATLPRVADGEPPSTSAIVAPLVSEGRTIGLVVAAERDQPTYRFDEHDVARLKNLTDQLATSLAKGLLHERIEFEARHDALTGLPARTLFEAHVTAAVARRDALVAAVLMLDLDRFKEVNDTLGHHAGDDLLVQFARRMGSLLQPGDILARLAGDEFAILCERATPAEVVEFATACATVGSEPVTIDGLEIVVTVSVGVSQITSVDVDATQPMRRADIAMYNAKWQRTRVEHYRDEIDRRTPARLSMLGDLRAAIENDDLDVVYQPKVDLGSGRVVGVEALVRWEHESRGVVAPTEFVRVAEDTGLIKELTDLVLARGIAMLRRLGDRHSGVGLAVNLSTHDLFDARLPERVREYLDRHDVPAPALTLEITESSLFVDAPRTRATIDDLHDVGLRLAIDDFGTGYSSLSYLRRLPVQELKVDQSFVAGMIGNPHDEVIVRSTIDLGHNLGLRVVAEGVESLALLDRLAAFHCDVAQGYAIAAPLAADELIEWVARAEQLHAADAASTGTAGAGASPTAWVARIG